MNAIKSILIGFVAIMAMGSCNAQTTETEQQATAVEQEKVVVYYFHYTRRCLTCNAVESVAKEAVEELAKDLNEGTVVFYSLNLDEAQGEQKAEELGASGQTLLIIKGEQQTNITNEAFMYARSNPDKLKDKIKAVVK